MRNLLKERMLVLDGAMGTRLQHLTNGGLTELLNLTHPEAVQAVHAAYLAKGSDMVLANSFGANAARLAKFGVEEKLEELNRAAVEIARKAGARWVVGSMGPTGEMSAPMGAYTFDDFYQAFYPQAQALLNSGVDLLAIETMMDVIELKAAVAAIRAVSKEIPLIAQVSLMNGRTLNGTDLPAVAVMLDAMEVDVIGINCVALSEELPKWLAQAAAVTDKPLIVQPNAGMPDEAGHHHLDLAEWRRIMRQVIETPGVGIVGGCCGTDPEAIGILRELVDEAGAHRRAPERPTPRTTYFSSRTGCVKIDLAGGPYIIGERINPSGRPKLAKAMQVEDWYTICDEGLAQVDAGAMMLDVNVGLAGINQGNVMAELVQQLQMMTNCPLVLDSADPEVLEAGLKVYVGKPLINSCNASDASLQAVLPLARKYGAAIVGLCMGGNGVPDKAEERVKYGKKIVAAATARGIKEGDIFLDPLVLPAALGLGTDEMLKTLRALRQETGASFIAGISNVSIGLPRRGLLNRTCLAMAFGAGLNLAIANPLDPEMTPLLRAVRVLLGTDRDCADYLQNEEE